MTVDGVNAAGRLSPELQIAQQNQQSAVKNTDAKADGLVSVLSKLNKMYSSTGENTASMVKDESSSSGTTFDTKL